jgi:glyoxylase I family protein
VGVACSNIEKSVEFYRDFLQMKVLQSEKTAEGGTVVILDAGGGGLELVSNPKIKDTPAPELPPSSAGLRHFSFAVGDMKKVVDFLKSKGVEFTQEPRPPKVMKNATGIAFCKDPDGNLVEFIERPKR